jgi:VanZ family protein
MSAGGNPAASAVARAPLARRLLAAWLPAILWILVIFWFSGERFTGRRTAGWVIAALDLLRIPASPAMIDAANLLLRKGAHVVEYGILGALLARAVNATWWWWSRQQIWLSAVLMAVSCASLDELRQARAVNRTGSPFDVLLDVTAAAAGIALVLWQLERFADPRVDLRAA